MKRKIALAFCLFTISFWIGFFIAENSDIVSVSATIENYDSMTETLLLIDSNGESWVFCNVSPLDFKNNDSFKIKYKGNFELLELSCNGDIVDFL